MAGIIAETNIAYANSPVTLSPGPRHAKVSAGQHVLHFTEPALQKQLGLASSGGNVGHTIVTIAGEGPAPAAGPAGQTQVLITRDDTPLGNTTPSSPTQRDWWASGTA